MSLYRNHGGQWADINIRRATDQLTHRSPPVCKDFSKRILPDQTAFTCAAKYTTGVHMLIPSEDDGIAPWAQDAFTVGKPHVVQTRPGQPPPFTCWLRSCNSAVESGKDRFCTKSHARCGSPPLTHLSLLNHMVRPGWRSSMVKSRDANSAKRCQGYLIANIAPRNAPRWRSKGAARCIRAAGRVSSRNRDLHPNSALYVRTRR